MKATVLIPPVFVLVFGAWWLGGKQAALSKAAEEKAVLQQRIAAFRTGVETDRKPGQPPGKAEWKALGARALRVNQTQLGYGKLRREIEALATDHILAGLDEIAGLGLGEGRTLKEMLLQELVRRDPLAVLDRYAGSRGEFDVSSLGPSLEMAMKKLATENPQAAAAWFDRACENGTFVSTNIRGISWSRELLEKALVGSLMASDPASAIVRLRAMPESSRGSSINDFANTPLAAERQADFIGVVRAVIPEVSQRLLIGNQASALAQMEGGLASVSAFLDRSGATDEERAYAAENAAGREWMRQIRNRPVTLDQIDAMRRWVESESPGSEDRVTGAALARISWHDFSQAAGWVSRYHDAGSGDEILSKFLDNAQPGAHSEEARSLAEKIGDEALRNQYLEKFK